MPGVGGGHTLQKKGLAGKVDFSRASTLLQRELTLEDKLGDLEVVDRFCLFLLFKA